MTSLDTLQKLNIISEKSPWIINSACDMMVSKLNVYSELGVLTKSMLAVEYLRELLFDCVKQVVAEGEYGFTV